MCILELAVSALTGTRDESVQATLTKYNDLQSVPIIDLSVSVPKSSFSLAAFSKSCPAISFTAFVTLLNLFHLLFGILVNSQGRRGPRTNASITEKEGLAESKESKPTMMGDLLPSRDSKSCEKPPFPMLSSLKGRIKSVILGKKGSRDVRDAVHPDKLDVDKR